MPWFLLLKSNWKLVVIGLGIIFNFWIGWHTHGWIYTAERAKELEAIQAETAKETAERNKIATDYEAYRSKTQAQFNALNQKWGKYVKTATDCKLSDIAVSLLQGNPDAAGADPR